MNGFKIEANQVCCFLYNLLLPTLIFPDEIRSLLTVEYSPVALTGVLLSLKSLPPAVNEN